MKLSNFRDKGFYNNAKWQVSYATKTLNVTAKALNFELISTPSFHSHLQRYFPAVAHNSTTCKQPISRQTRLVERSINCRMKDCCASLLLVALYFFRITNITSTLPIFFHSAFAQSFNERNSTWKEIIQQLRLPNAFIILFSESLSGKVGEEIQKDWKKKGHWRLRQMFTGIQMKWLLTLWTLSEPRVCF